MAKSNAERSKAWRERQKSVVKTSSLEVLKFKHEAKLEEIRLEAELKKKARLEREEARLERDEAKRLEREEAKLAKRLEKEVITRVEKKVVVAEPKFKFQLLKLDKIDDSRIIKWSAFGGYLYRFPTFWGNSGTGAGVLQPRVCFDSDGNKWLSVDGLFRYLQMDGNPNIDTFILGQLLPIVFNKPNVYRFGDIDKPSLRPLGVWKPVRDVGVPLEWVTPDLFLKLWDQLHTMTGKAFPAKVIEPYIRMLSEDKSLYPKYTTGCNEVEVRAEWERQMLDYLILN